MTKQEAYESMKNGHKVAHEYFGSDEYIYMDKCNRMFTEEGYRFERGWEERNWNNGWFIKEENND